MSRYMNEKRGICPWISSDSLWHFYFLQVLEAKQRLSEERRVNEAFRPGQPSSSTAGAAEAPSEASESDWDEEEEQCECNYCGKSF